MITIDETISGTRRKKNMGPKGRFQTYFCGHALHVSEWPQHDCEAKRAALSERECAHVGCKERFTPVRKGQRFHSRACARKDMSRKAYSRANEKQAARKGLTPEQIQAMEVEPIAERDAAVVREAESYRPLMGEELYLRTMELMKPPA